MKVDNYKNLLEEFSKDIKFDHELKKKTWFNIGGKSKIFYKANNLKDLVKFLKIIDNREKIFILGAGSNTLIPDHFFDGIVIKLGKNFNNISLHSENIIIAGGAVLDKTLSEFAMKSSVGGLEFLYCIPGSVGGGIRMNAGCFEKEFKDVLLSIQVISKLGDVMTIPSEKINFEYRGNDLSDDLIFLSATFKGFKDDKKNIMAKMEEMKNKKENAQPSRIKTSGSTFKNPVGKSNKKVWELIKESVALDKNFGDAYISEKHCNFFVNKGNATFEDMNNLINYVTEKVFDKTGIKIEKEIKILK
ncbi:MAG: UDP-N-acetylmuramate dehydrogenase [Proteobacteria bacterium]|nr:MAG: UDP-N-acetylmuramate dehydrogenase [Pseudomonadota bacterium]